MSSILDNILDKIASTYKSTKDKENTNLYAFLNSVVQELDNASERTQRTKNDSYISVSVTDEPVVSSGGDFDKLSKESIFEITSVSLNLKQQLIENERATSVDSKTVRTNYLIKEVSGVWLANDIKHHGTNYYTGGSFSRNTITLGSDLPATNTDVVVTYDGSVQDIVDPRNYQTASFVEVLHEDAIVKTEDPWTLIVRNSPVISVRSVYNLTRKELYTVVKFNNNEIKISGKAQPKDSDVLQVDYEWGENSIDWTPGRGLLRSSDGGTTWNTVPLFTALERKAINDIEFVGSALWVATNDGLYKTTSDGVFWTIYKVDGVYSAVEKVQEKVTGFRSNIINEIASANGVIWVATSQGLSKTANNGSTWRTYTTSHGLPSNNIKTVVINDSTVFVGTDKGIAFSSNGGSSWTSRSVSDGLINNNVTSITFQNSFSKIWVGTSDGLSCSVNEGVTWKSFKRDGIYGDDRKRESRNGKYFESGLGSSFINCVYVEPTEDKVWVGTSDGLSYYNSNLDTFETYKRDGFYKVSDDINNPRYGYLERVNLSLSGLKSNKVLRITSNTFLWIGTDNGISKTQYLAGPNLDIGESFEETSQMTWLLKKHVNNEKVVNVVKCLVLNSGDLWVGIDARVKAGETYYVSYKYGARWSALINNFGKLINLYPTGMTKELYRKTLIGLFQAYVKGPTYDGVKTLIETFTNYSPLINETYKEYWLLGRDVLNPQLPEFNGKLRYKPVITKNGIVMTESATLRYPTHPYLSTKEGTLEFWIVPMWNGSDGRVHYFFDISQEGLNKNRISFYKGSDNNLHFVIFDKVGHKHEASCSVSTWEVNSRYFVTLTWRLGSGSDFMNIYVDGNLSSKVKYGTGFKYGTGVKYGQTADVFPQTTNTFYTEDLNNWMYIGCSSDPLRTTVKEKIKRI